MISKIIQKEKERQEEYLKVFHNPMDIGDTRSHWLSLINLKEDREEQLKNTPSGFDPECSNCNIHIYESLDLDAQLKEDIKELELMIRRYENV